MNWTELVIKHRVVLDLCLIGLLILSSTTLLALLVLKTQKDLNIRAWFHTGETEVRVLVAA